MIRLAFVILIVSSFLAVPARTQNTPVSGTHPAQHSSILGTVLDPKGAVVPRASVTLSTSTEALETSQTDNRGQFAFADLTAGTYRIVATAPGLSADSGDKEPDLLAPPLWSSAARFC